MAVGAGGGWSCSSPVRSGDGETDANTPLSFSLLSSPGSGSWEWLPIQDALALLRYISLKAPSETCQEVCLLCVCKSSHEDGHHTLHLCFGDSSKSTSFGVIWVSLHPISTQETPGPGMHDTLLSPFPLVTEHV